MRNSRAKRLRQLVRRAMAEDEAALYELRDRKATPEQVLRIGRKCARHDARQDSPSTEASP